MKVWRGVRGRNVLRSIIVPICFLLCGCGPAVQNSPVQVSAYARPIRLACVGDSLTANEDCWPGPLGGMMGERWDVRNFGVGGSTVLSFGDTPYASRKLPEVLAWNPDVAVILLGTNDSKPRHWYYKREFERDYGIMLETLQKRSPGIRIWVCLPPPAFPGQWGIDAGRLLEMQPVIRRVARRHGIPVLDLHSLFAGRPERFPDQVHPDAVASKEIARHIYQAVTGVAVDAKP